MKRAVWVISIVLTLVMASTGFLSKTAAAKSLESGSPSRSTGSDDSTRALLKTFQSSLLGESLGDLGDQESETTTAGYTSLNLNLLMENCSDPEDTDGDSLPDEVEKVLGTDPESPDSDEDNLSDLYELTHNLDPLNPDTNNDGMSDYSEILEYGDIEPGTGEEDYLNIDLDTDQDGEPNVSDRDNDGDGVPDGLDLSPFSYGLAQDYYQIAVTSSDRNLKYVDFQIQPENLEELYTRIQTYDWPYDDKGNIQDSDYSTEDMTVKPMAEIELVDAAGEAVDEDELPSDEDCILYGMIKKDGKLWLSLLPVEDNGKKVALQGKLYLPNRGRISTQYLRIRLVWSMEFTNDRGSFQWTKQAAPFSALKNWKGAGVTTGDIDGNGKTDLLVSGIVNGDSCYSFWYTIGYDVDVLGNVKGWSGLKRVPVAFPGSAAGGGAALYNLDQSDNEKLDVIFASVVEKDGPDQWVYVLGYDLDNWGDPDLDDDGNPRWSRIGYGPETGDQNSGAGIAVSNLNGHYVAPDLVFMSINSVQGADQFRYAIHWDFLPNRNSAFEYDSTSSDWSTVVTSPSIGCENSGGDVAVANLDDDSRLDLVFSTIDNPTGANQYRYYIAWNIAYSGSGAGKPTGWSSASIPPFLLGDENAGNGIAVDDFDLDGKQDLVLLSVDGSSGADNRMSYRVGSDFLGSAAAWSDNQPVDSTQGYFSSDKLEDFRELDCKMRDLDGDGSGDMLLGWSDQAGYFRYSIGWDFDENAQARCWSQIQSKSLGSVSKPVDGVGFDLYDINKNGKTDLYLVYNDAAGGISTLRGWDLDSAGRVSSWSGVQNLAQYWQYYYGGKGLGVSIQEMGCENAMDVVIASAESRIINTTSEQAYAYETNINVVYDLNSSGRITERLADSVLHLVEKTSRDKSHEQWEYDNNDKYYELNKKQYGVGMDFYDFNHDGQLDILLAAADDVSENDFRSFMIYGVGRNESSNRADGPDNAVYANRDYQVAGSYFPQLDEYEAVAIQPRKLGLGVCLWDITANDNVDGLAVMVEIEDSNMVLNIFTAGDLETSTLNILEESTPFVLSGLTVDENCGGKVGVIYNNDHHTSDKNSDIKANYTDALATYEILRDFYVSNFQGTERSIAEAVGLIGQDNGEDIGDFSQLSVPQTSIADLYHSDQAQLFIDQTIVDLDESFNGRYSKLPVITAVTSKSRQLTLDNLETPVISSATLVFNLNSIDYSTTKLIQMKGYDFSQDEVVEIEGIIDLVGDNLGVGLTDLEKAQLAQILIAHHMGEITLVRVGSDSVIPPLSESSRVVKYLSGSISTLKKVYIYSRMISVGAQVTSLIFSGSTSVSKFAANVINFYKIAYSTRVSSQGMWALRNAMDSHNFCGMKGVLATGPKLKLLTRWAENSLLVAQFGVSVYAGYQVAKAYNFTGYGFYAGAVYAVLTFALPLILFLIPKVMTAFRAGFVATGFGALIVAIVELSDFITFLCCGKSWSQMAVEKVFNWLVGMFVDVDVDLKAIAEDLEYDKMRAGLFVLGSTLRDSSTWQGIVKDINRKYHNSKSDIGQNYMIPYVYFQPRSDYYDTQNSANNQGDWITFTDSDDLRSQVDEASYGASEVWVSQDDLWTETTTYEYDNSLTFNTLKANLPVIIVKEYEYMIKKWKRYGEIIKEDDPIHKTMTDQTTLYFDVLPSSLKEFEEYYYIQSGYKNSAESETHAQAKARLESKITEVVALDPDGDGLLTCGEYEQTLDGTKIYTSPENWDTDYDGVGDCLEITLGTDAVASNGGSDSDDDGLSDLAELRLGTDPCLADSDGDGLTDSAEVTGWDLTLSYNGTDIPAVVCSNPLVADTDGDGLTDKEEYDGYTNPGSCYTPGRTLDAGEEWSQLWDGNLHAPVISAEIPDSLNTAKNHSFAIDLDAYFQDPDGDYLSYSTDTGKIDNDGIWSYTYTYDSEVAPRIEVTIRATDNRGKAVVSQSFILEDTTCPVLTKDTYYKNESGNLLYISLDGATNVKGANLDIRLFFSDNIRAGDNYTGIELRDSAGEGVTCTNSISGKILYIAPDETLVEDKVVYTLTVPAGAVEDLSSNELANEYSGSFTTRDITPPALVSQPADNTGIGPFDELVFDFHEDITRKWPFKSAYIAQTVYTGVPPTAEDVWVSAVNYDISAYEIGDNVTFTLGQDRGLQNNTLYKLVMEPGFVQDLSGNQNTRIEWSFTTGDVNSPVLVPDLSWDSRGSSVLILVDNATPEIELNYSEALYAGPYYDNIRVEHESKKNLTSYLNLVIGIISDDLGDQISQYTEMAEEEFDLNLNVPVSVEIDSNVLRLNLTEQALIPNYLYRIIIPAGSLEDGNGLETSITDKMELSFADSDSAPQIIWSGSLVNGELIPGDNPYLAELNPGAHMGIAFNMPITQGMHYEWPSGWSCPITLELLDEEGNPDEAVGYDLSFESLRLIDDDYAVRLELDHVLAENSTYRLTIPAGTFQSSLTVQPNPEYIKDFTTGVIELPGIEELETFGLPRVGESIYGLFRFERYNDLFEGTSRFQWYVSDDEAGTDLQPIEGASGLRFDIPDSTDYSGKYLWFEVTPNADNGTAEGISLFPCKVGPIGPIGLPYSINNSLELLEVESVVAEGETPEVFLSAADEIQSTWNISTGTEVKQVTVRAVPQDSKTAVYINNTNVTDTGNELVIDLNLGINLVSVCVTSENGLLDNLYLINIMRSLDDEVSILPEGWVEILSEGDIYPGTVLNGLSNFFDEELREEGDSLFKWYRGDASGQDLTEVGTGLVYRVTADDTGYYLYLEMTPSTSRNIVGEPVLSPGIGPVLALADLAVCELTSLSILNGTEELINNFNSEVVAYQRSVGLEVSQVVLTAAASPDEAVIELQFNTADTENITAPYTADLVEGLNFFTLLVVDGESVPDACFVTINRTDFDIPSVSDVRITGDARTGASLQGEYEYNGEDGESGSLYVWYRSDNSSGQDRTVVQTGQAGYSTGEADAGAYLFFEVQPVSSENVTGAPVCSDAFGPLTRAAWISQVEPLALGESGANDGRLDPNTLSLTVSGGSINEDITEDDVIPVNLPDGLTYSVVRDNDSRLTITLGGQATAHGDINDISDLFFSLAEESVTGATGDLTSDNISLDFDDPYPAEITSVEPTVLLESPADDGSLSNGVITLTINNGSLVEDLCRDNVTVSNLPDSLDYAVNRDNATRMTISISGCADNHTDSDDVYNLTFTIEQAAVSGAVDDLWFSLDIDFDPLARIIATSPTRLVESAANDGSLESGRLEITIAAGELAADITVDNVTTTTLPLGLDYAIVREDATHLIVNITGSAEDHSDIYDVNNLSFTLDSQSVANAGSDLTTTGLNLDFNDAYTLTLDITGQGNVVRVPDQSSYLSGTVVELSADPDTGWSFSAWSGTDSSLDNTATVNMNADRTVGATFTINTYTVKFNSQGGSPVEDQTVDYGDNITRPVDPLRAGYAFSGWYIESECINPWDFYNDTVSGNMTLYGGWSNSAPFISHIVDQTVAIGTATGPLDFSISDNESAAVNLEVNGASDNTTLVPDENIVLAGSGAGRTVTITPAAGQTGSALITLTVSDEAGLTACDNFTLRVDAAETEITVMPASAVYGNTVDLEASLTSSGGGVPGLSISFSLNGSAAGSALSDDNGTATLTGVSLAGLGAGSYADCVAAVFTGDALHQACEGSADLTVSKAELTVQADNLTMTAGDEVPELTVSYTGFVNTDTAAVLSGSPALNTTADSSSPAGEYPVTVSPGTLSSDNYTFIWVDGKITVSENTVYTLTVNALPAGSGTFTCEPEGVYHNGDEVQITATPTAGYSFQEWSGDAAGTDNPVTVIISGDTVVNAVFSPVQSGHEITDFAVIALDGDLEMSGKTMTVSDPSRFNEADIYAHGNIFLNGNIRVEGDVTATGEIQASRRVRISGLQTPHLDPPYDFNLPDLQTYPELAETGQPDLENLAGIAQADSSRKWTGDYTVRKTEVLGSDGGVAWITGDLIISGSSRVQLSGVLLVNGTVTISGNARVYGSGTIISESDADRAFSITGNSRIQSTGEIIRLIATAGGIASVDNSQLEAALYAPAGDLTLTGRSGEIYLGPLHSSGGLTITGKNNLILTGAVWFDRAVSIVSRGDIQGLEILGSESDVTIFTYSRYKSERSDGLIISSQGEVVLSGLGRLYASILAPAGSVKLYDSVEVYGSVIGQSVSLSAQSGVIYPHTLR